MKKHLPLVLCLFTCFHYAFAQNQDSIFIRKIFDEALVNGRSYEDLRVLCKQIGPRLSGSANAEKAVVWGKKLMESYNFDTVYLQPTLVPHWERGSAEVASFTTKGKNAHVRVCALGGSVATEAKGLSAKVIEVNGIEALAALGEAKLKGKIVFFNRPMEPRLINTFQSYGGCVDQRYAGAKEAAKFGAVGVVVRSMSHKIDTFPHTGVMAYDENGVKIPAVAISTQHAEQLSKALKADVNLLFFLKLNCKAFEDKPSFNVIGEIRGSEFPNEIVLVGGHLDSWDNGEGAHDDGAGVVQSIESLRLLKALSHRPKRTIRVVLFMNEENGLRGAKSYADLAKASGEKHLAAIESDRGGFSPRGFSLDMGDDVAAKILKWRALFEPYGVYEWPTGGSGSDIAPLKPFGTALIGFVPDSQRYFDHHHAETDNFEAINKRELELGGATMSALLYLLSEYGL